MISVVICAFNEERHIADTITNVIDASQEAGGIALDVIVVDDGSQDKTGDIISQFEEKYEYVRSIRNPRNAGLGRSIISALAIAKYPQFMIAPGDNDLPKDLLRKLFNNHDKADLVLAYLVNREDRGRFRNLISIIYGLIYMCFLNVFVLYINSPCIYPTEMLRKFRIKSKRFTIVAEITIKCLRSGCTFHEVAGYMQRGRIGSSALTFQNFVEVVVSFCKLLWEVKISHRKEFNQTPIRIY